MEKERYNINKIIDYLKNHNGNDDIEKAKKYIEKLNCLASDYYDLEDYNKALELSKLIYDKSKEVFGENHLNTLQVLGHISSCYSNLENYDKAFEFAEIQYRKMKEVLGEDDSNILDSEYDVLFCYSNLINYSKEVDLETIKYAKRKASLESEHWQQC